MKGVEGTATASSVNDHGGESSAAPKTKRGEFGDRRVSVAPPEAQQRSLYESGEAGGISGTGETYRPHASRHATTVTPGPRHLASVERHELPHRPTEVEPPTAGSRTDTAAASPASASTRGKLDWIVAYRRMVDLGYWFSKEGQPDASERWSLARKRVQEAVRYRFKQHSKRERYQLPPGPRSAGRPEQMYRALQDMARGASDRGDDDRAGAIRWDIGKLDGGMTAELAKLASVFGSIDDLAAAGLPQLAVAVTVEPAETSRTARVPMAPPLQRTLPEGAGGRQRGLVPRNVGRVNSRETPYPGPEERAKVNWIPLYDGIKSRYAADVRGNDLYATAASAASIREIDRAVLDAYRSFRAGPASGEEVSDAKVAMSKLRALRSNASRVSNSRLAAIRETMHRINRLTLKKHSDLALRSIAFAGVSSRGGAAVPGREVLEAWLLQQAAAAGASSIEHRYFTQLANELAGETDPWSVSLGLVGSLPAGDADQAERLRAAHCALVQAMAGTLSASSPRPGSLATANPVPDGSQASVSRQHPILTQLFRHERLSNDQRQAILAGVSRATAAGSCPVSTSHPETWAAGLLQRIQENIDKSWAALTGDEKAGVVSDWTQMRDLIQTLDAAGYL